MIPERIIFVSRGITVLRNKVNVNLMQLGNIIYIFLARHVSGTYAHTYGWCRAAPSAPYTRPTQRLSRPPPIQKLGAENHMLQLNI